MHSLAELAETYKANIKNECLPVCIQDLCAGWTTDTFKQVLVKFTEGGTVHPPLVFHYPAELSVISTKRGILGEVFKLFDTRALSRIDSFEILYALSLACTGALESKIENCFSLVGIREDCTVSKEEFHFFIDNLVRGVCKIALLKTDTFYPRDPNQRLSPIEITLITESVFANRTRTLSAPEFCR